MCYMYMCVHAGNNINHMQDVGRATQSIIMGLQWIPSTYNNLHIHVIMPCLYISSIHVHVHVYQ